MQNPLLSPAPPQAYHQDPVLAQTHLLEVYKLYVEMADRVSARRNQAHAFFLTLHSSGIAALALALNGALAITPKPLLGIPFGIGVLLCVIWWLITNSYRQLNSGKYNVVGQLEQLLPVQPYAAEWEMLGGGKDIQKYFPVSHVEMGMPFLFALVYLLLGIYFMFLHPF